MSETPKAPDEIPVAGAPLLAENSKPTGNNTGPLKNVRDNNYEGLAFAGYRDGMLDQVWNKYMRVQHLTINSTTPIGQILFKAPVHPQKCNPLVTYFSAPFLTWAGTMRIKVETISTAMMNVQLCAGWLDSSYNSAAIDSLTPAALSTIDSQMTVIGGQIGECNEFAPFSANQQNYFRMAPFNENDPSNFGGWLIVWVKMPLVSTSNSEGVSTTIHIDVSTCGAFLTLGFNVASPILNGNITPDPSPGGNIPAWALGDVSTNSTVGAFLNAYGRKMNTTSSALKDISAYQVAYGKKGPYTYSSDSVENSIHVQMFAGVKGPKVLYTAGVTNVSNGGTNYLGFHMTVPGEVGGTFSGSPILSASGYQAAGCSNTQVNTNTLDFYSNQSAVEPFDAVDECYAPSTFSTSTNYYGVTLAPMIAGENIVTFTDGTRTCVQFANLNKYFTQNTSVLMDDQVCYYLDLVNIINDVPAYRLRLCPDGLLYTDQTIADFDLDNGFVLKFYGQGTIADVIPPLSAVMSNRTWIKNYRRIDSLKEGSVKNMAWKNFKEKLIWHS